jgi:hypothetical protein
MDSTVIFDDESKDEIPSNQIFQRTEWRKDDDFEREPRSTAWFDEAFAANKESSA